MSSRNRTSEFPYYWADGRWHRNPENATANPWAAAVSNASSGLPGPTQPADPNALAAQNRNNLNSGLSTADANYQSGNLGYDTGYNPDGTLNTSNPYSQAALLEENFKRSQLGTENSYAAQGQFNSGAYGRMQNENQRNYSINSSALQTYAGRGYHGIQSGQAQNAINYGDGTVNPQLAALFAALKIPGYGG